MINSVLFRDIKASFYSIKNIGFNKLPKKEKEDDIDMSVGVWVEKRLGDRVEKGDVLFKIYANDFSKIAEAKKILGAAVKINDSYKKTTELIYAIILLGTKSAISLCASSVLPPTCGVKITLSKSQNSPL